MALAGVEAARLGVRMFNVHAAGGAEMMAATVAAVDDVCRRERLRRPILLAVTVLTSLVDADLRRVGVAGTADAGRWCGLARLAQGERHGRRGRVAARGRRDPTGRAVRIS